MTKIIQITDTHLFSNNETDMFGIKSNYRFIECLEKIKTADLDEIDYIFLTGDVSQDDSAESYRFIANSLADLNLPVYWIPGNHDDKLLMKSIFSEYPLFFNQRTLSFSGWKMIFLDTNVAGAAHGFLSSEEIDILQNEITSCDPETNIGLVMHHHPIEIGTPLIDQYILKNNPDLWKILDKSNVKLIICGHVHGDYHLIHQGVSLHSSPATCLQWKKGTTSFTFTPEIGYKIHCFTETHSAVAKIWCPHDF